MTTEHESLLSSLGEAEKYAKELEGRLAAANAALKDCLVYAWERRDELANDSEQAKTEGAQLTYFGGSMSAAAIADFILARINRMDQPST